MKSMFEHLRRFRKNEEGTTLVEYGIALIIAITVGSTLLLGLAASVKGQFTTADGVITSAQ